MVCLCSVVDSHTLLHSNSHEHTVSSRCSRGALLISDRGERVNCIMKHLITTVVAAALWCGPAAANTNVSISGAAFHAAQASLHTCDAYGGNPSYYYENGCVEWMDVVAALPFVPTGTSNMTLWVDGYRGAADGRIYTTCTVTSYNYDWTYLGSASAGTNVTGNFDLPITLQPAALSAWAYLTIKCNLSGGSRILGVIQTY